MNTTTNRTPMHDAMRAHLNAKYLGKDSNQSLRNKDAERKAIEAFIVFWLARGATPGGPK